MLKVFLISVNCNEKLQLYIYSWESPSFIIPSNMRFFQILKLQPNLPYISLYLIVIATQHTKTYCVVSFALLISLSFSSQKRSDLRLFFVSKSPIYIFLIFYLNKWLSHISTFGSCFSVMLLNKCDVVWLFCLVTVLKLTY